MEKILYINACVRPRSRTQRLAEAVLKRLSGEVEELKLDTLGLRALDWQTLQKQITPESRQLASRFAEADTLVVAAPYWNLTLPALLLTYLENICVAGVTFRYTDAGYLESLCRAKRLYYVTTSGGWIGKRNHGYQYVKNLFTDFFGVKKTRCICAEGLDIDPNQAEQLLQKAIEKLQNAQLY